MCSTHYTPRSTRRHPHNACADSSSYGDTTSVVTNPQHGDNSFEGSDCSTGRTIARITRFILDTTCVLPNVIFSRTSTSICVGHILLLLELCSYFGYRAPQVRMFNDFGTTLSVVLVFLLACSSSTARKTIDRVKKVYSVVQRRPNCSDICYWKRDMSNTRSDCATYR